MALSLAHGTQSPAFPTAFERPGPTIGIFVVVVAITFVALYWRHRRSETPSDYYVADRKLSSPVNGMALFGAYLFISSFFTLTGQLALVGMGGFLFAAGFLVAWLTALLLFAEPIQRLKAVTLGDVLSVRLRQRPARIASAVITLVLFFLYIVIQLVLAGDLAMAVLRVTTPAAEAGVIVVLGVLAAAYALLGGMRGVTRVQAVKAVLLLAGVLIAALIVLAKFGGSIPALLGDATHKAGPLAPTYLSTSFAYGTGLSSHLSFVSKLLTLVAGQAILPFLFMRYNTVPTARAARRSAAWATGLIAPYYLCVALIGFGVVAVLGGGAVTAEDQRNAATPRLAAEIGGTPLLAFLGAVGFLIVLGVVAGLMFNAAATYTHDFYVNVMKKGQVDPGSEVRMAKWAVVWLAIAGVAVTVALMRQNVEFLLSFEVNLAASTVLPVVVYSLFWKRFSTSGMLWTIYGGGAVATVLEFFGPEISGSPTAFFTSVSFDWFPWGDVGLVSVPVAFLLGYLGSRLGKEEDRAAYAEFEVRVLTGASAEPASLAGVGMLAASDGLRETAARRPSRIPQELSRPRQDLGGQADPCPPGVRRGRTGGTRAIATGLVGRARNAAHACPHRRCGPSGNGDRPRTRAPWSTVRPGGAGLRDHQSSEGRPDQQSQHGASRAARNGGRHSRGGRSLAALLRCDLVSRPRQRRGHGLAAPVRRPGVAEDPSE